MVPALVLDIIPALMLDRIIFLLSPQFAAASYLLLRVYMVLDLIMSWPRVKERSLDIGVDFLICNLK